jgi:hypothetical protein
MKKIVAIFILCYLWLPSFAQTPPEIRRNKLIFLTTVTTNSGANKGYLWQLTDSTIVLSPGRKLNGARLPFQLNVFPEKTIQDFTIKRKRMPWYYPLGGAISGFLLTGFIILKSELDDPDPPSKEERAVNRILLGLGTGLGFVAGVSITFKKRKISFKVPFSGGLKTTSEPVIKFIKGQVDLPVQAPDF